MTATEQETWNRILNMLDKEEYSKLHKFYSSTDGWAKLSYKDKHVKVFYTHGLDLAEYIVKRMLGIN